MSQEDGARFVERLFPQLRPRYVHHEDDEDVCQIVLWDMLKKWDSLNIMTDQEFTSTFSRFYGMRQWIERTRRARQLVSGTYWLHRPGGIPSKYLGYQSQRQAHTTGKTLECDLAIPSTASLTTQYNPWCSHRTEALEWIARLPTPLYRRILTLYYIEGYTLPEVGAILGWHRDKVGVIIKEGVALLRATYKAELEEGRSLSGGPTTHE